MYLLRDRVCGDRTQAFVAPFGGCRTLPPRTEAVGTVYGEYVGAWHPASRVGMRLPLTLCAALRVGTWKRPGLYCINPCGFEWRLVTVNNRAVELKAMKCADQAGNSILISGVITFRVVAAAVAVFDMIDVDAYVHLQAQAVLKQVASQYKYITYDNTASLITEQAHLGEHLRSHLQQLVSVGGVEVVTFQLSDLAYAPEIASAMLVRQQAQATLDARKMIVSGAVGIACDALAELAARGKPIAPAEASKFVSNLVVVLCGEKAPTPTIEL